MPCQSVRAALLLVAVAFPGGEQGTPEITARELIDHVKFLADDQLEGRCAGSVGAAVAADYIAEEFERLGLQPVGDAGTYFQGFAVPRGFKARPETSLAATIDGREYTLRFERDIYPLPCSACASAEGAAVFAGYGISAPELDYDDYQDLDVKGKIVVVLRGAPNGKGKDNPFQTPQVVNRFASFRAKLDLAGGLGAVGLVVVNDPVNYKSKSKDELVTSGGKEQGKIPGLHATYAAGGKLLAKAGVQLSRVQKSIDSRTRPRSEDLPDVRLRINSALVVEKLDVRNVVGLLKAGAADRKEEQLLIGAHFDHIGLGEFGSLGGSKARGEVHNGADDNASGTAAVLEIAGLLAPRAAELKRDVLFVCFTAEEMGLLGSEHYVEAPLFPLHQTAAMLNLDMVGCLKLTGKLEIYGVGTAPCFQDRLDQANRATRVKLRPIKSVGRGASDHYPFYKKGLPVLFFITGLHKYYHRPSDDWKNLDPKGFEKVVNLVGLLATDLATSDQRPVFTPTTEGGLETGPYLGVTVESKDGDVVIAAVADGSPADRAGLKVGDRVAEVDGNAVDSVTVFYGVWAAVEPDSKVSLMISRDGRMRTVKVQLKS